MKKVKEYAFSTVLETSYEEAVSKVIEVLKEEGFGVLTEIEVKSTLKKKLNTDFRKYLILGACNPPYAYRALQTDLDVGLLLPCNVIIYEMDDKKVYVAALNPVSAMAVIKNEELKKIALEVSVKLKTVVERVALNRWVGYYEMDPAIQSLITNLSSSDEILRIHSRESLVKIGKPAVPQLVEALMGGSHWLRWEAAKTLGEIGDPIAAPTLSRPRGSLQEFGYFLIFSISLMVINPFKLLWSSTTNNFSILFLWRISLDSSSVVPTGTVMRRSFVITVEIFSSNLFSNLRSRLVRMPTNFPSFVMGTPEIRYFLMISRASKIF
jgi:uncharacterized protein (DUF302 family)